MVGSKWTAGTRDAGRTKTPPRTRRRFEPRRGAIEEMSAECRPRLIINCMSEVARALLAQMPTAERLMPSLTLPEAEAPARSQCRRAEAAVTRCRAGAQRRRGVSSEPPRSAFA
jgi:hypothetical protein